MYIQCLDNDGFEDQLTQGQTYQLSDSQGYSIQLNNDNGQLRWYGRFKFSAPVCMNCSAVQAA